MPDDDHDVLYVRLPADGLGYLTEEQAAQHIAQVNLYPALHLYTDAGVLAVTIEYDGRVTLGLGCTTDEASRLFWQRLGDYNPLQARVTELEAELARDKQFHDFLAWQRTPDEGDTAHA